MKLGDLISFERDGEMVTERVESVRYTSGSPAIYRRRSWWQRILGRKSTLVRAAELPSVTINGDDKPDPVGKTLTNLEAMKSAFGRLT